MRLGKSEVWTWPSRVAQFLLKRGFFEVVPLLQRAVANYCLGDHIQRNAAMTHERIVMEPDIMFGKPTIKGTRITVEHILRKLAAGMSIQQILADHPHLSKEDIYAAAGFAADYMGQEEIVLASGDVP